VELAVLDGQTGEAAEDVKLENRSWEGWERVLLLESELLLVETLMSEGCEERCRLLGIEPNDQLGKDLLGRGKRKREGGKGEPFSASQLAEASVPFPSASTGRQSVRRCDRTASPARRYRRRDASRESGRVLLEGCGSYG
jgi:hypothetical protein